MNYLVNQTKVVVDDRYQRMRDFVDSTSIVYSEVSKLNQSNVSQTKLSNLLLTGKMKLNRSKSLLEDLKRDYSSGQFDEVTTELLKQYEATVLLEESTLIKVLECLDSWNKALYQNDEANAIKSLFTLKENLRKIGGVKK